MPLPPQSLASLNDTADGERPYGDRRCKVTAYFVFFKKFKAKFIVQALKLS